MCNNANIRIATPEDAGRIAEIEVFNYRLNFYPIFQNDGFYFDELQVLSLAAQLAPQLENGTTIVYDDGAVKGFLRMNGPEIEKLFVEPALQGRGIGSALLIHAVENMGAACLWALEKNLHAIRFYQRHGFSLCEERKLEEDTTEYLVLMKKTKRS